MVEYSIGGFAIAHVIGIWWAVASKTITAEGRQRLVIATGLFLIAAAIAFK